MEYNMQCHYCCFIGENDLKNISLDLTCNLLVMENSWKKPAEMFCSVALRKVKKKDSAAKTDFAFTWYD